MRTCFAVILLLAASLEAQVVPTPPTITLRPGLVITRSVRIAPRTYRLPAAESLDSAVLVVRGENLTVDFGGAILRGTPEGADPDRATGVAIRVEGGKNVRIFGARLHGYKVGILARNTRGLRLIDNDASYNWKPRLYSLIEHESLVDWLSFHHNEKEEWLRYGAAFYLSGVQGGEIRGNTAVQGMNGLLLVRSDSLRVADNDFSFNSGLGVGLYRSSDNTLLRNRLDYDVRGYSHRFYRRGQDSAGLLLYEQSMRNVVAWNSATHGGDGLFLWAGQSTMDTGEGGANDNVFFENDFSFAPANAMEATFSRNLFVANRAAGSDYGLWGGYSFGSKIVGNCFVGNRVGIAIEHGQDNVIKSNRFAGDTTAVSLWANPIEPSDWGYPKHRDTRSRGTSIEGNSFRRNRVAVRAANTLDLAVVGNALDRVDSIAVLRDTSGYRYERIQPPLRSSAQPGASADPCDPAPSVPADYARLAPDPGRGGKRGAASVPGSPLTRRDRSAIIVDEWGPYDWRSPKLWPVDSSRALPLRLRVLGPPGTWRVVERQGIASLSQSIGRTGDTISVTPQADWSGDWSLLLEYRGERTVSPRGSRRAVGAPSRFGFGRFEPTTDWEIRFYAWNDSTDVRKGPEPFAALTGTAPLLTRRASRLDFEWYRPTIAGLPQERFALEATASVTLAPGEYGLRAISDDGIRVWVDGALVIDRWAPHESAVDSVGLAGGRHELRVQFYQADGWTELRVEIVRP